MILQEHTLIEWATKERYNCIDIKDTVVARRFNEYGYKSLEDAINDVEKELQEYAEKYGKYYYNEKMVLCWHKLIQEH